MHHQPKAGARRGLLIRIGMLASLTFAGLSLGGCVFYVPPHYHHWGY